MKNTCIKNFSFIPSDYDCMVTYLNEMLAEGWRLKWVKAGFAGFVRTEPDEKITYVVEPYPNTSLITLRRMPKAWLNFYTSNNWNFVGKSRGNFIYVSTLDEPKPPTNTSSMTENNSKAKVLSAETLRNAFLLVLIALGFFKAITSKAFMYSYVLTNMHQYISCMILLIALSAIAVIFMYSLETVRVASGSFQTDSAGGLKRGMLYHIRNFAIIGLALIFFVIENLHQPAVLLYLLFPVVVLAIGGAVIISIINRRTWNNPSYAPGKDLMPIAMVFGAVVMVILMLSMTQIQKINAQTAETKKELSLQKADTLPILRYQMFFDNDSKARSAETDSHFGSRFLYEEADEKRDHIIFTNYSVMNSQFAAKKIFDYLYYQAQIDYMGVFEEFDISDWKGADADSIGYRIADKNAYLIKKGNTIILTTVTGDVGNAEVFEVLNTINK